MLSVDCKLTGGEPILFICVEMVLTLKQAMFQVTFKTRSHSPIRPDSMQGGHLSLEWAANVPVHSNQCVFFFYAGIYT